MSWMKPNAQSGTPETRTTTGSRPAERPASGSAGGGLAAGARVNIGSSMQIKGELTSNEDLVIDGKVEGKVYLNDHVLTVGANGLITAEIHDAHSVVIHGEIRGNITASDRVEVASTGSMHGDIRAPRVVLADGASFRGQIDMEPGAARVAGPEETKREATTAAGRTAEAR